MRHGASEGSHARDGEVRARERGLPGRGADARAHVEGVVAGAGEEVFGWFVRVALASAAGGGGGEGEALG